MKKLILSYNLLNTLRLISLKILILNVIAFISFSFINPKLITFLASFKIFL